MRNILAVARPAEAKRSGRATASCPPKLAFPDHFARNEPQAVRLIEGLLNGSPGHRLGMRRTGTREVRDHLWFGKGYDWDRMLAKKLKPPFVPALEGQFDVAQFEEIDEEERLTVVPFTATAEASFFADF
jgi:hypothetical protein